MSDSENPRRIEIFGCLTAITAAEEDDLEQNRSAPGPETVEAIARLRAVYDREQSRDGADGYLTEMLGAAVPDADEAVALFELALEKYEAEGAGEETYTTRLSMADRLIDLQRYADARAEIETARADAEAAGDTDALGYAESIVSKLPP